MRQRPVLDSRHLSVLIAATILALAGCGGQNEEMSAPEPIPPPPPPKEVYVPPLKEPQFNTNNINETLEWAYKRAKYLRDKEGPADAAVSANALNDELMIQFKQDLQSFRDDLDKHIGEPVSWPIKVDKITNKGLSTAWIYLQKPFDASVKRPFLGLTLEVVFREGESFEQYSGYGMLPLGTSISREFAKTLKPGDVITVKGTIKKFKFESYYNHWHNPTLHIYVGDAKVSEP